MEAKPETDSNVEDFKLILKAMACVAKKDIESCNSLEELQKIKSQWLGKKGMFTVIGKELWRG